MNDTTYNKFDKGMEVIVNPLSPGFNTNPWMSEKGIGIIEILNVKDCLVKFQDSNQFWYYKSSRKNRNGG
jgi:hypothetical protein